MNILSEVLESQGKIARELIYVQREALFPGSQKDGTCNATMGNLDGARVNTVFRSVDKGNSPPHGPQLGP